MSQHRAKHRASAGGGADQLATVLIERLRPAAVPSPVAAPTRRGVSVDRTPRASAAPLFQVRHGGERSVPLPADAPATARVRHRNPSTQPLAAALTLAVAGVTSSGVGIMEPITDATEKPTETTGEFRPVTPGGGAVVTQVAVAPAAAVTQAAPVEVSAVVGKVAKQMKEVAAREVAVERERREARRGEAEQTAAAARDAGEQDAAARDAGEQDAPRVAGSSAGAAALRAAMGKIGKPYRWGAAGPNAFDCSGLVQWAFKQVGVSLPHSSRAMSTMGKRVSAKDLQPGDLVFYYSPVSHVAIYIGDGKVVNATQSGKPVKISRLDPKRLTAVRRLAA